MYSYEDRIRAVKLYIKLGKRTGPTIRQLGVDPVLRTPYGSYRRSPKCPNHTPPSRRIRRSFVSR